MSKNVTINDIYCNHLNKNPSESNFARKVNLSLNKPNLVVKNVMNQSTKKPITSSKTTQKKSSIGQESIFKRYLGAKNRTEGIERPSSKVSTNGTKLPKITVSQPDAMGHSSLAHREINIDEQLSKYKINGNQIPALSLTDTIQQATPTSKKIATLKTPVDISKSKKVKSHKTIRIMKMSKMWTGSSKSQPREQNTK